MVGIVRPGALGRELGVDPWSALNSSSRGREWPARLGQASPDPIPTPSSPPGKTPERDLAEPPLPPGRVLPGE